MNFGVKIKSKIYEQNKLLSEIDGTV